VLVHIDVQAGEQLVNHRLAYVALSRGRYDAQIYTNDKSHLAEALNRDVSHRQALEPSHALASVAQVSSPNQRVEHARGFGLGR
jgi:ATP-dependent exoDNAse (exonuclease V) alpha subunit